MTVLSLWVKNPISSHSKQKTLVGVEYETEEEMLMAITHLNYDSGFILRDIQTTVICTKDNVKIVEYELKCSTVYAEQHKDSNQALWKVNILVMEEAND